MYLKTFTKKKRFFLHSSHAWTIWLYEYSVESVFIKKRLLFNTRSMHFSDSTFQGLSPFFLPPLSQRSSVRSPPPNAVVIDSTSFLHGIHSIPMQHYEAKAANGRRGQFFKETPSKVLHQWHQCLHSYCYSLPFNLLLEKFHSGGGGRGFALFPSAPLNLILKEIRYSVWCWKERFSSKTMAGAWYV